MYTEAEEKAITTRLQHEDSALELATNTSVQPEQVATLLAAAGTTPLPQAVRIVEVARRQEVPLRSLFDAVGVGRQLDDGALITADLEIKYSGYFERERVQADRMKRMGDFILDTELGYDDMLSLSFEARQKLGALKPRSLAQASRIPGVSPNDLQNLVVEVERRRRLAARQ
jgi:tRNA uridine 5-carboxymethylaminomethyl modification enzyme